MGNCLQPVMRSEVTHDEEDKAEEAKPLVISTMHDQGLLRGDQCCKKRKKVRFEVQPVNAVYTPAETTMSSPRMMKGVRVKVVLTQSELKQILNRTSVYHHPPPLSPISAPPPSSSYDQISGQMTVKCRRIISRRSAVMCRCSWNPALHAIPE